MIYKITPLGILFPASVTSDTSNIFVLGKKLNGVKNSILNNKIFDVLAVIGLTSKDNQFGQTRQLKITKK